MIFCVHCGKQLPDEANFCNGCGKPVEKTGDNTEEARGTKYEGAIHKCPRCGEVLQSFTPVCPACGHEMRDTVATAAVREFANKLETIESKEQKIAIIRAFPIPNNKEDILEFMSLASCNFDAYYYAAHLDEEDVSDAWLSKVEQCHDKAKLLFGTSGEFDEIHERYQETYGKIARSIEALKEANDEERSREKKLAAKIERDEEAEVFKKSKKAKLLWVFAGIAIVLAVIGFASGNVVSGIMASLMVVFMIVGWSVGMNAIPVPSKGIQKMLTILVLLLCVPLVVVYFKACSIEEDLETFEWSNIVLKDALPQPSVSTGKIHSNSDTFLVLDLYGVTETDFMEYKNRCIDFGYTERANTETGSYGASNSDNYRLSIYYLESSKEISVTLKVPEPSVLLNWEEFELGEIIPKSELKYGRVISNSNENLNIYLSKATKEIFGAYVNMCKEAGFSEDVSRLDNSFEARKGEEYKLNLFYNNNDAEISVSLYYDPPIALGATNKELKGKNYEDVIQILEDKGFTNIETRELDDLVTGWLTKEGEVESVSVNGATDYSSEDKFFKDIKIVVTYHTFSE